MSINDKKDIWDKIRISSGAIAAILIPLVVAIVSMHYAEETKRAELDQNYLKIAIEILSQPPNSQNTLIRDWAIQVFSDKSPVNMDNATMKALMDGQLLAIDKFINDKWIPAFVENMVNNEFVINELEKIENGTAEDRKLFLQELLLSMIPQIIDQREEMQTKVKMQPVEN